jgi:hypothetical protein
LKLDEDEFVYLCGTGTLSCAMTTYFIKIICPSNILLCACVILMTQYDSPGVYNEVWLGLDQLDVGRVDRDRVMVRLDVV